MRYMRCICLVVIACVSMPAAAQLVSSKPVRLVVPYPPGFTNDIVGRLLATKLSSGLGQNFIVENRPGAEGQLGAELVAKAAPDGHTLLLGANAPIVMRPIVYPDLSYSIDDFTPVSLLGKTAYLAVVHPSLKVNTVQEFVALVKTQPGKLNYASVGGSGGPFLCMQLLKLQYGIEMQHVPYKGGAQAMSDLAAGRVQFFCGSYGGIMPFVKAGTVRAIGSATLKRSALMPELPTFIEQGIPDFEAGSWQGILGPKKLPQAIVRRISDEGQRIMLMPDAKAQLLLQGVEGPALSAEDFSAYLKVEIPKWTAVVKAAGIKPDD